MSENVTIHTSTGSRIIFSQRCLCCDNSRELPEGMTYCNTPWICDDCKKAIEFLKFLKSYDSDLIRLIMESKK